MRPVTTLGGAGDGRRSTERRCGGEDEGERDGDEVLRSAVWLSMT